MIVSLKCNECSTVNTLYIIYLYLVLHYDYLAINIGVRLNYNHLYYFYVTGLSKNATEAAKRLRISQPSLCSQLKTLEEFLQVKLFKKSGRNRLLTDEGEEVFSFCCRMFHISEELGEYIHDQNEPPQKALRIGIVDDIENSYISNVVNSFLSSTNDLQRPLISSTTGRNKELIDKLKLRELDIVISSVKNNDNELTTLTSIATPIVFITSSKSLNVESWDQFKNIRDLIKTQKLPFVLPSKTLGFRQQIDSFLRENGINIKVTFETDNMSSIVRSVIDDVGVALIPYAYLDQNVSEQSLKVFNPIGHSWQHTIYLKCNSASSMNETNLNFAKCFNPTQVAV